jgi:porin
MNRLILSGLAALTVTSLLHAGDAPGTPPDSGGPFQHWLEGDHLMGNWDGFRDRLEGAGIDPFLYYTNIMSGNPTGGSKPGFTYVDDFYFGVHLDLDKVAGWHGASLTISGVNRDGPGLNQHYIHSQFNEQQTVGGQNTFFYQLTLEQKLFNDKLSIKIGRFAASDDLNASPIYSYYVDNAFNGDIRNVLFDTQFSAYPFATWGARVAVKPSPEFYAQVAVFQAWDQIFDAHLNGLNWRFHQDDGVILMAQAAWTPEFDKKPVSTESEQDGKTAATEEMKGLPGHYWIGGTFSPWAGYSQFLSAAKTDNSYGVYAHADQMVYQKRPGSDEGLTLWAASGFYPQGNISIMPLEVNAGMIYKGLLPGRGEDRAIFGVAWGQFSRDYAQTIEAAGKGDPHYEMLLEGAYRYQVTKFMFVEPDVQYDVRPAGTGRIPNALVVGAEMGVTF